MHNPLEKQISEFRMWRESVASTISEYRDWLEKAGVTDSIQDLRLFDLSESLKRDQLVIAFVAEFARGKTETINALFFSDYKTRLLPCDSGRTTMCPTEIFYDANEAPCIKLLPIETRKNDESLSYLKKTPAAWTVIRLDTGSVDSLRETFHALVQQREVTIDEAKALGLWDESDLIMTHQFKSTGRVNVPVWRHALVNFPHPLLKSGLVILDTPGLNTLGSEPELTINIIPNAHAVIFMLATDTGVTKSDMAIWNSYIRDRASRKLAVLNKIDILWDDLKSAQEVETIIQSQVDSTARQLSLDSKDVFAISAQKALLAKVKNDPVLLARSGIESVEQVLALDVVKSKHSILCNTVITEVANLVKGTRKTLQQRLVSARARLKELTELRGKNRDVVQSLLDQVSRDRQRYEDSIRSYSKSNQKVSEMGEMLMHQLSLSSLDRMLEFSRREMGDAWTTHGLNQGMKQLMRQTVEMADEIKRHSEEIKGLSVELYQLFHSRHGFEMRRPPALDMSKLCESIRNLLEPTEAFCSDPVNVMTEKHFLVKKFFVSQVVQARAAFEVAHFDADIWLKSLLSPLKIQISEHKAQLDKRTESLMTVHENLDTLEKNISDVEAHFTTLQAQAKELDLILLKLMRFTQSVFA